MIHGARRTSMAARPVFVGSARLGSARRLAALVLSAMAVIALAGCAGGSRARELTGDLMTHDPALAVEDGTSYVYSTGNATIADGNIQIRSSDDGRHWRYRGEVWEEKPDWLDEAVPGVSNLWAPELIEHDGTWYLYYSASTFGSNASVIALATNETLDPDSPDYEWVDAGQVLASTKADDFNAIDAGIVVDEAGDPWMSFGSFWSGIRMVPLEWPGGGRADASEPRHLADRQSPPNAVEAPYIVARDGDYFLFVSRDACCQGLDSTYNIAVGRSEAVDGPYLDRDGVPLVEGDRIGPGGQSVQGDTLALHYYDRRLNGSFQLALVELEWDAEGWPVAHW
ncbi:arabinan endo-1,5-alpha-L-arabinosidase [Agromyces ramosus]|uniref:Arabinan endo-1,5-alpha-L-arabinosidase n=1 Tax=Agromyces ramosus TaxID=33879 RepID=A0ABU0RAS7_9MICO|nr:arabinan endo-1,5-alpha-L-arabinosidase [Agromyces ramosus]MDQ0895187.1 arabinan endo-1,5-alpha-L-arabinosidase [Agromyces ramosus]